MYLKNIVINNIGPIENLFVKLHFKENGDPKPIIFAGENGSGKTILLAQIIDSFYEISSNLFYDIAKQDGLRKSYYKISGGFNLQVGKEKGFSALIFTDNGGNQIEYLDKVGKVTREDITNLLSSFLLILDNNYNQKIITTINDLKKREKLQNEWLSGAYFYQPAYRYEEPFWKNDIFLDFQRFEDKIRFSNQLKKEIEIISSTKENKSFLMDLVLDSLISKKNSTDKITWQNINNILKSIKKRNDITLAIGSRGGYRVTIGKINNNDVEPLLPSIDNLSLGELVLFNLFVSIIRHADNQQNPKTTEEIQGIVAIDEIDVHLHTDLQTSVLPELIKLFPKIQFIITTHSPLFLLGMKRIFGEEGFEVINMPKGELITTERFSEFENAYNVLKETERFENEIRKKVAASNKPIVYVEGPTDVQYIKRSYELYSKTCDNFDIEIIGEKTIQGTKNSNNQALYNAKTLLSTNLNLLKQKVILLFDPEEKIKEEEYEEKLYIRKIPQFEKNPLQHGIENLFEQTFIDKVQTQFKSDFSYTNVGGIIKDFKIYQNKQNICNWICQNGTKDDFKNFKYIIEIIEKIIKPESKNNEPQQSLVKN